MGKAHSASASAVIALLACGESPRNRARVSRRKRNPRDAGQEMSRLTRCDMFISEHVRIRNDASAEPQPSGCVRPFIVPPRNSLKRCLFPRRGPAQKFHGQTLRSTCDGSDSTGVASRETAPLTPYLISVCRISVSVNPFAMICSPTHHGGIKTQFKHPCLILPTGSPILIREPSRKVRFSTVRQLRKTQPAPGRQRS